MPISGKRLLRGTVKGLAAFVACSAIYLSYLQLSGNFHEVIAGEFYRSAQPTGAEIEGYAHRYGIKTIVNLRGASSRSWYKDEVETAAKLGITHVDFPMSAGRDLPSDKAMALVEILKNAPKPILIHCLSGADRSGLASVIYLQQVAGIDEETAEMQLWPIVYGHVGIPFLSKSFAMDESWENFEKVIGLDS
ncbi:dual specificity protein phosphatase family protein [Rhizobium paknamense]|uniref:Protein tyrosine/serine phosphatase n=1 Tax=Rhizobium paknamense TaxID=1206817 RepID=A0ABU0IAQ2_9HYPH|nr:dual specificity protein phosphatase family protein [Rhizobium paknamense]MDQ0455298.1 protein tyrosine/serine phosphatase [Rhizobium paknamense]